MTTELVIARHDGNVDWIKNLGLDPTEGDDSVFGITIYDKAPKKAKLGAAFLESVAELPVKVIELENKGSNAHSFLTHFAEGLKAGTLADRTLCVNACAHRFCQEIEATIRGITGAAEFPWDFLPLADTFAWDDPKGTACFVPWDRNPKRQELDIASLWEKLFPKVPMPGQLHFGGGGQFAITREAAQRFTGEEYEKMAALAAENWKRPFEFERLWAQLFDPENQIPF